MNYRERLKNKKRIVIKIGSSSLTHPETGRLNLRKLEVLARELCDLQKSGKGCRACLFRSHRYRCGSPWTEGKTDRIKEKTGMCGSRTGKTDDDLSETVL